MFLHVIPESVFFYPWQGSYKDVSGRVAWFQSQAAAYRQISLCQDGEELTDLPAAPSVRGILVEYTHFSKTVALLRRRFPDALLAVRAHNIEPLHHLDNIGWRSGRSRLWMLWGMWRLFRQDVRCKRIADVIYSINDCENRLYWNRLPGRARIEWLPYFCPDELVATDLLPTAERRMIACMPGDVDCLRHRDMAERFQLFAEAMRGADAPLDFCLTGTIPDRGFPRSGAVTYPGMIPDLSSFLGQIRAVALLSPLGRGFKTSICDAMAGGAYAIAHPRLVRRCPEMLRPGLVPLDTSRLSEPAEIKRVLRQLERPFPLPKVNGQLKDSAWALLRRDFLSCDSGKTPEQGRSNAESRGATPPRLAVSAPVARGRSVASDRPLTEDGLHHSSVWRWGGQFKIKVRTALGLQGALERRATGGVVLMYHNVVECVRDPILDRYAVDVQTLDAHLRFFRRHCEVVPLSQIVERLRSDEPIPASWVAITFDDALEGQVTLAAEILDRHQVPWALAVPAGLVGTGRSVWSYELRFLLLKCWPHASVPSPDANEGNLSTASPEARVQTWQRILLRLETSPDATRWESYLDELIDRFGRGDFQERLAADGRYRLADWGRLRELQTAGVELLSHGWKHRPQWPDIGRNIMAEEIVASRQRMLEALGRAPAGFSLPHGVRCPSTSSVLQEAGYAYCVSSECRRVHGGEDPFNLPRFDAEYPLPVLRQHLLGYA